ncbi:hypothetical protein CMO94_02990 [Candidatus Woesearchaeota archaeon]|jgi:hypothetical protein|nr:hypothetical protein [Candidatus Woesearchaeota archaeon]
MLQKKQITLIVFSVILLLFIAGCEGGDEVARGAPTTPFLGGSQGLEIKFLEGSPPDEITDVDFPFQAIVSLKNIGEYRITSIEQVRVNLLGILASDFGALVITNKQIENEIYIPTPRIKDSEGNIIEAVETFVTIPAETDGFLQLRSDAIKGNTKFTFRADVCYQYGTNAIGSICVLQNMIDIADDSICEPKGPRPIFSSGSPVKVAAFRQSVVGKRKIQFSFDIAHSGSGNVFENEPITFTSPIAGCPKDPGNRRTKENRLDVRVTTGIPDTLMCVGADSSTTTGIIDLNDVRLTDGKRTITCTQNVPGSDFEKNIDINIKFNYLDSIDKVVLAKHLSGCVEIDGFCGLGETIDNCPADCS